jgi:hypothetical protein
MKIDASMPEDERRCWEAVRLDYLTTLPGVILEADEMTGVAKMRDRAGEEKVYNLAIGILRLRRR